MDNGIVQVTLSNPGGIVTGIRYNGIDNLLEVLNRETNRGYMMLQLLSFNFFYRSIFGLHSRRKHYCSAGPPVEEGCNPPRASLLATNTDTG